MEVLEALKPAVAITGQGLPMTDDLLTDSLRKLVQDFDSIAIPDYGNMLMEVPNSHLSSVFILDSLMME